jgi:transposase
VFSLFFSLLENELSTERISFSELNAIIKKEVKMGYIVKDDGNRIPDFVWEEMKQIIPKPIDNHPLKCHRKRIDDRKAMDGIFFVLRTGCQWQALDATGICKHSVAHKRFQEWARAGVFFEFWWRGLMMYDATKGLQLNWQSLDGSTTKAPLGGEKTGANPTDRAKKGQKEVLSSKEMEFLSELLSTVPTDTTRNSLEKRYKAFQSSVRKRLKEISV